VPAPQEVESLQDTGARSTSTHSWRSSGAGHRGGGCHGGVRSAGGASARARCWRGRRERTRAGKCATTSRFCVPPDWSTWQVKY